MTIMLHPYRIRHNRDTGADVQQGPVPRILFRLRPCVNLFYCLLLLHILRILSITEKDADVIGISPRQNNARTWTPGGYYKGYCLGPVYTIKTEYLRECSASRVWPYMHQLRIIVFGKMLGLPGSCVLLPYAPLHRLTRHQENYCDCALVHPDEHLSRQSRKLTVMI